MSAQWYRGLRRALLATDSTFGLKWALQMMTSYMVPFEWVTFFFYTHSYLRICSTVFEMQSTRLGLTIGLNGTTNPSTLSPRSSDWCIVDYQSFVDSFSPRSLRLKNATSISSDSHMGGQLKNSSSQVSRTSTLTHVNRDISKNLVMQTMQGAMVVRSL